MLLSRRVTPELRLADTKFRHACGSLVRSNLTHFATETNVGGDCKARKNACYGNEMGNDYRLVGVKNSELLAGLSELVQRGNEITGGVLAHLAELEERMLHLELGFPSLFAYCVQVLGMSEAAAGRRVAAARVCRRFPEAFELVAQGDLHLSALCELSPHLKPENASELFGACRRKTRRGIEAELAARFPRADVREQIRRLPVRAQDQGDAVAELGVGNLQQEAASAEAAGIGSNREPAMVVAVQEASRVGTSASLVGMPVPRRRELEALSVDRFGVHFTADAELLRELIERARALASHRLPKGDLAGLLKLALTTFVQHEEKRRFALGVKPRKAAAKPPSTPADADAAKARPMGVRPTPPGGVSVTADAASARARGRTKKRRRHVSAAARREVRARDGEQCSFVSEDGRRCDARAFLEIDHIEPWAALGAAGPDNLRLRCRAHNQLHARNCFGAAHMAAKVAAKRNGQSPVVRQSALDDVGDVSVDQLQQAMGREAVHPIESSGPPPGSINQVLP
jgi:hypothetical protein